MRIRFSFGPGGGCFPGCPAGGVEMGAQMEGTSGAAGRCPLEKRGCGGCPMLSLPYGEQLRAKQARLEALLGEFGPVAPILGIGGVIQVASTGTGMGWIIALAVGIILVVVAVLMRVAMPKFKIMQKLVDRLNLVTREILTGLSDRREAAKFLHSWGAKEVLITHNTEVLAYDGREMYTCPIKARNLSGRTGRGDTTFAGYITERQRADIPQALLYCTALVSRKMETPGPFRGTRQEILDYIREFY